MAGYQPITSSHLLDRWASVMTISTGLLLVIYLGDPHQLEQVFLNTITNAKDAIESYDHACDNAFRQDRRLTIQTHFANGDKDRTRILFTDSGCGIGDTHTGQIFDPFLPPKRWAKALGSACPSATALSKNTAGGFSCWNRALERQHSVLSCQYPRKTNPLSLP